ncbi:MAG TPA: phosphatase PAP2 family protein [Blastocatellia bacterium]|nr:phosphatase PAP2 family protein [Blastocatellia bacterium]
MFRIAEWVNLLFFVILVLLAWARPLTRRQRMLASGIGLAGIGLSLAAAFSDALLSHAASSTVRDWLPAPLMLLVYWLSGCFFTEADEQFQAKLQALDRWLLQPILGNPGVLKPGWLAALLELAYLFCYALVPLGVAVLYFAGKQQHVDAYWAIVLPSTYSCYVLLPFFQTYPPRLLESHDSREGQANGLVRTFNLAILDKASITVNTFPSAHVAATMSSAFALMGQVPHFGVVFLIIAIGIAIGAVAGRYHYTADALLATAIAGAVVLVRSAF